jgi:hypothetical protein
MWERITKPGEKLKEFESVSYTERGHFLRFFLTAKTAKSAKKKPLSWRS